MNFPIEVGISKTLKIRGVIAERNINIGETIEVCPMLVIDKKYEKSLDTTPLTNYYFEWNKNHISILLGYGCLYNHSYSANAELKEDKKKRLMIIKAYKKILKGEEITINYNGYPNSKLKLSPNYLQFDK